MGWKHGTLLRLALLLVLGVAAMWIDRILGIVVIVVGAFLLRTSPVKREGDTAADMDIQGDLGDGGSDND